MCQAWDELLEESYNKGAQEKEEEMKTIFDEMVEESYNRGVEETRSEMKIIIEEKEKITIRNMLARFSAEEIIDMGYGEDMVREIATIA